MNKTMMILLAAIAVVGVAAVSAHGMGFGWQADEQGTIHEDVESVVETGTLADLETLREDLGRPIAPWVETEEDFAEWQEMHEAMEEHHEAMMQWREEQGVNGFGPRGGYGMHGGSGQGPRGFGGCPMMG